MLFLEIIYDAMRPGENRLLFLVLDGIEEGKEAALHKEDLVLNVRTRLDQNILYAFRARFVTVDQKRNVLCACLCQLAAEQTDLIFNRALGRDQQNH